MLSNLAVSLSIFFFSGFTFSATLTCRHASESGNYFELTSSDEQTWKFRKISSRNFPRKILYSIDDLVCTFRNDENKVFSCTGPDNPFGSYLRSWHVMETSTTALSEYIVLKYYNGYSWPENDRDKYTYSLCEWS